MYIFSSIERYYITHELCHLWPKNVHVQVQLNVKKSMFGFMIVCEWMFCVLQSTKNEKQHLYILPEKQFLASVHNSPLHNCYTLCIVKVRAKGVALLIHSSVSTLNHTFSDLSNWTGFHPQCLRCWCLLERLKWNHVTNNMACCVVQVIHFTLLFTTNYKIRVSVCC